MSKDDEGGNFEISNGTQEFANRLKKEVPSDINVSYDPKSKTVTVNKNGQKDKGKWKKLTIYRAEHGNPPPGTPIYERDTYYDEYSPYFCPSQSKVCWFSTKHRLLDFVGGLYALNPSDSVFVIYIICWAGHPKGRLLEDTVAMLGLANPNASVTAIGSHIACVIGTTSEGMPYPLSEVWEDQNRDNVNSGPDPFGARVISNQ